MNPLFSAFIQSLKGVPPDSKDVPDLALDGPDNPSNLKEDTLYLPPSGEGPPAGYGNDAARTERPLDDKTVYLPPIDIKANPYMRYDEVGTGTGRNPPAEGENRSPAGVNYAQMAARDQIDSIPGKQPVDRIDLEKPQGMTGVVAAGGATEPDEGLDLPLPGALAKAPPLPLPQPPPSVSMEMTGADKKGGSTRQKISSPSGGSQEQMKNFAGGTAKALTESTEQGAKPVSDSRIDALSQKQKSLDGERLQALEKAAHATDLSSDEQIAMALVSLLPALVGGIVGGAVAPKAGGAAAGVAGGLGGASEGIQRVMTEKQKDKQTQLATATQAAERGDKIDSEVAQRQGLLEKMQQERDLTATKEKGDTERARAANAAHLKAANIQAYTHLRGAQIAADGAIARAEAKAKQAEEGGALKDYQGKASSFATKMMAAEHVLRQVKEPSLLNSFRTWGSMKNALTADNPQSQMYARAVYGYLDAIARDESGAAINEGEWDQYFNTYFPRNTSSPEDVQYAARLRNSTLRSMLGKAGPLGAKIAVQSFQDAFSEPKQGQGQGGMTDQAPSYQVRWDK